MIQLRIAELDENCILRYVPNLFYGEQLLRNTIMFILELMQIKCYN